MWLATSQLPKSPGHPFYQRLNVVLEEAGFDRFAEKRCERFYAGEVGRPSLPPGRYFRLLLLRYFEGLEDLGFGEGPFEVGVADLVPAAAEALPGGASLALDEARVGGEVRTDGKREMSWIS